MKHLPALWWKLMGRRVKQDESAGNYMGFYGLRKI
jgi:hypothetical protein